MPGSSRPKFSRLLAVTVAGSTALVLAVAGLAPYAAAAGGGVSAEAKARASANAEYRAFHREQAPLEVPALPARPPSDRSIVISTCPVAVCHLSTDPAVAAAKMLGWTVTEVELPLTGSQPVIDLWEQVIADPPDLMVYYSPIPIASVQSYVDRAAALGVKIVDIAPKGTVVSPVGPVYGQVNGAGVLTLSGRLMADAVVHDSHPRGARSVWISDPTRPFFLPARSTFFDVITSTGGSVDRLDVALGDLGTRVPGQVVEYVRTHPKVRYLAFALNDLTAGVPAALEAAGLQDRVKIIGRAPSPFAIADIRAGRQWAAVTEEKESAGWRNIDQLARLASGVPIPEALRDPVGWHMIVDQSNVGTAVSGPVVPGFPEAFLAAWHMD